MTFEWKSFFHLDIWLLLFFLLLFCFVFAGSPFDQGSLRCIHNISYSIKPFLCRNLSTIGLSVLKEKVDAFHAFVLLPPKI